MPKTPKEGIKANAPMQYYCVECGHKIDGEPYEMSMASWEDSVDPVYFCSKECEQEYGKTKTQDAGHGTQDAE